MHSQWPILQTLQCRAWRCDPLYIHLPSAGGSELLSHAPLQLQPHDPARDPMLSVNEVLGIDWIEDVDIQIFFINFLSQLKVYRAKLILQLWLLHWLWYSRKGGNKEIYNAKSTCGVVCSLSYTNSYATTVSLTSSHLRSTAPIVFSSGMHVLRTALMQRL